MKRSIVAFFLYLLISGLFAQISDPFINPTLYGVGMTIVAKVKINGVDATTQDLLVAVVGNQVRAKVNLLSYPQPVNGVGRTFLIQTQTPNEEIIFKVWSYSEQRIYESSASLMSVPGGTLGNYPSNVYEINANITRHNISGQILHQGSPVPNIPVNVSQIVPFQNFSTYKTLRSDSNGKYLIPDIKNNSNITFAPVSTNYNFTPVSQTYNSLNSDQVCNFISEIIPIYTVSGTITANGQALSGVTVSTGTTQTVTNAMGFYQMDLPGNINYTITPSKTGWNFSPQSISLGTLTANAPNNNFTASPWTYSISGNCGIDGAQINFISANQITYPVTVSNISGAYSISGIQYGDNINVIPYKEGYVFTPANRLINNIQGNQTANFQANIIQYTITGNVTKNGIAMPGVNIAYGTENIQSNAQGQFPIIAPWHTSLILIPTYLHHSFSPSQIQINEIENNMNVSFEAIEDPLYLVSGTIRKSDLTPLSECNVNIQGQIIQTNQNGYYSRLFYPTNEIISIVPSKAGYSFNPEQINLQGINAPQLNLDFTASPQMLTISGRVTGAGVVGLTLSGDITAEVMSDAEGFYSIGQIPYLSSGSIIPSKAHYSFNPPQYIFSQLTASLSQINFSAIPDSYLVEIHVRDQGNPLSNALITHGSFQGLSDINGYYAFYLPYMSSVTVSVSKENYFFIVPQQTIELIQSNQSLEFNTRPPLQFSVSGYVRYQGQPLSQVLMVNEIQPIYTDQNGYYSLNVNEGSSLSISPQKEGYQFNPAVLNIQHISASMTQDFTAQSAYHQVSGQILLNSNQALANVKVYCNNDSVYTDAQGFYTYNILHGSALQVRAQSPLYQFNPISYQFSAVNESINNLNFNAVYQTYTLTGRVTWNNIGLGAVLITASHNGTQVSTDANGYYQLTINAGTSTVISPSLGEYFFSPATYQIPPVFQNYTQLDFAALIQVKAVTFSLEPGIYTEAQNVSLNCETNNAQIYYTLDLSDPGVGSNLYTTPLLLETNNTYTIKARAFKNGYLSSVISSAQYQITGQVSDPQVSLPSGVYDHAINVEVISDDMSTAYYTLDGQDPTESSTPYLHPIMINQASQLKVRAYKNNYIPSAIKSWDYSFNHILSIDLPDTININQNMTIIINLGNYIEDSVIGTHDYLVNISDLSYLNINQQGLFIQISPQSEWIGEETMHVSVSWPPSNVSKAEMSYLRNTVEDSVLIRVRPLNQAPVINSWIPENYEVDMTSDQVTHFIVNAMDNDSPLYYRWYVDQEQQAQTQHYFSFSPQQTGNFIIKSEVTDLTSSVFRQWLVHVTLSNDPPNPEINAFRLYQNYPNPFNPVTKISFDLPKDENVTFDIYNIQGQHVRQLLSKHMKKGTHQVIWDAKDDQGKELSSGIYLYKIRAGNFIAIKKAILIK